MDIREAAVKQFTSRHPWEVARAQIAVRLLKEHQAQLEGPIVDVGCGDAYVLSQLKKAFPGLSLWGVDSSYEGQFEPPPGIRVLTELQQLPKEGEAASILTLMDVLEHLEDPSALLQQIHSLPLIGSKTLVLVTVPAYQFLFGSHDRWLGHYRRYDQRLLRQHLEAGGVRVMTSGYFFFSGFLLRLKEILVARLSAKSDRNNASELVAWEGSESKSRFWARVLMIDFWVGHLLSKLGIRLPGLSCYALGFFE